MSLLSTAYAGSADISPENADALLNQILPDGPLGMVYIPEAIQKRAQPGLVKVVHWLQHDENGVGVEGTIPVGNLVEALLERNEKLAADDQEPDELVLALLYDPASGLDVSLAKEAHAAGIRVINLRGGRRRPGTRGRGSRARARRHAAVRAGPAEGRDGEPGHAGTQGAGMPGRLPPGARRTPPTRLPSRPALRPCSSSPSRPRCRA